jgi:hypothetical protein
MRYRALVLTIFILFVFPGLVMADPPSQDFEGGTVVASGFNGPQGITIDSEGNLWVIDSGLGGDEDIQYLSMETGEPFSTHIGPSARIVKVSPGGEQTDVATLPSLAVSDMEMVGGARLTWLTRETITPTALSLKHTLMVSPLVPIAGSGLPMRGPIA